MKNLFYSCFYLLVFLPGIIYGQGYPVLKEKCATNHSLNYRLQHDPALQQCLNNAEANAASYRSAGNRNMRHGLVTIPVVFHVVYNPSLPESNIPDSLIHSQVQVLNEDFSRTNTNASNTRSVFDSIAVDMGVRFCLATSDPNGNPTTGINRISSTTSHALTPFNNSVKSSATGGADPWPSNQYLNIWVCDMSFLGTPFVLGYAQFPGDDPLTDGVVIQYQYIGVTNSSTTAPSNLGRTTTHEVGHWLGLRHVWGDGDCSADDLVDDTPWAAGQSNFDCNLTINSCDDAGNAFWGGANPPDMVENFMDYSADDCMNMFSRGQADRAWSFLSTDRIGLFASNGCGVPELNAYVTVTHNQCRGFLGGIAVATPVSGTPPYTFQWDDPNTQTDSMAVYLAQGTHHCTITDAAANTIVVTAYVYDPYLLQIASGTSTNATCSTCADGSVNVSVVGGSAPYQYSLNGGANQSGSVFNGLNPGTYTVTVTDVCNETQTISLTVGNSVGVDEEHFPLKWDLYPNPADENFNIDFKGETVNGHLEILTVTGQIVQSETFSATKLEINTSAYSPGIYLIRMFSGSRYYYHKLIIQ